MRPYKKLFENTQDIDGRIFKDPKWGGIVLLLKKTKVNSPEEAMKHIPGDFSKEEIQKAEYPNYIVDYEDYESVEDAKDFENSVSMGSGSYLLSDIETEGKEVGNVDPEKARGYFY
jgi:hypothetical protein